MALHLHLVHSLGERLVELEARPMERPIVIGRAASADVEVPSSSVSKRHCVLFVRDGRWTIRDAGSTAGTYLNGHPLEGDATLSTGDVIALGGGGSAPTVTVDPHGQGVCEVAELDTPLPMLAPADMPKAGVGSWTTAAGAGGNPSPLPPPVARVPPGVPQYRPPSHTAGARPTAEERTGWEGVSRASQYYVPKRKRVSAGASAFFAVLAVAMTAGGGFWIYRVYQDRLGPNAKVIVIQRPRPATVPATTMTAPVVTVIRLNPPAPATAPEPEPVDPRRLDPEWVAIEQARYEEPALAIVKFNDFVDRFPDHPFKKEVGQYIDEAVDRIWWKRLTELFQERDAAKKEIADRRVQLKQSQDAEFKKGLETEIAAFKEKADGAEKIIREEMKYASPNPPNLFDAQELAMNRANRDASLYAKWHGDVLTAIKRSRGQRLPWSSSR